VTATIMALIFSKCNCYVISYLFQIHKLYLSIMLILIQILDILHNLKEEFVEFDYSINRVQMPALSLFFSKR
jgi:hypothetical protein